MSCKLYFRVCRDKVAPIFSLQEKVALQQENALLKGELAELRRLFFGSKRERFVFSKKQCPTGAAI